MNSKEGQIALHKMQQKENLDLFNNRITMALIALGVLLLIALILFVLYRIAKKSEANRDVKIESIINRIDKIQK